jgi:hypothetical protein
MQLFLCLFKNAVISSYYTAPNIDTVKDFKGSAVCPISKFTCRVWVKPGNPPVGMASAMAATWTMHLRNVDSQKLSLIPVALSARTVKVSLNSPKINYYPPTHVSVCQVVQFIMFYNKNRVCTSVTTRYGTLLLLLMLSNGQQVLTASWLPACLGRLTDVFMVTTEGRWRALLTTAASDSGKRR